MKTTVSLVAFFSLALGSSVVQARTTPADADHDGLIEIYTLEELNMMRYNLEGTSLKESDTDTGNDTGCAESPTGSCHGYELMADLDFDNATEYNFWDETKGWIPIGELNNSFIADFEGNNHSLSNLYINNEGTIQTGLFAFASNNSFKNIRFIDAELSADGFVSALISYYRLDMPKNPVIENISITYESKDSDSGELMGDKNGALIAEIVNQDPEGVLTIQNITTVGSYIDTFDRLSSSGGLIGSIRVAGQIVINNVYTNMGTLTGDEGLGGIVGIVRFDADAASLKISNCVADGEFTKADERSAGIVGYAYEEVGLSGISLEISNCSTTIDISNSNENAAGLIGVVSFDGVNTDAAEPNTITINNVEVLSDLEFNRDIAFPGSSTSGVLGFTEQEEGNLDIQITNAFYVGEQIFTQVNPLGAGGIVALFEDNNTDVINVDINDYSYFDDDVLNIPESIDASENAPHGRTTQAITCAFEKTDPEDPTKKVADYTDCAGVDNYANYDNWDLTDTWDLRAQADTGVVYPKLQDTDGDNFLDTGDTDDDNDGIEDESDPLPKLALNSEGADHDNDGVPDTLDALPLDASEQYDNDQDGTGDNADTDDDNDGTPDTTDACPFDASGTVDTDQDGTCNATDTDDDGDGVLDGADAFPEDGQEWLDTDNDTIGNNADPDDDNDGTLDGDDAFPTDATETLDTDGDGVGNNADNDDDGDGEADETDFAPLDPNVQRDPSASNGSSGGGGGSLPFGTIMWMLIFAALARRSRQD